MVPEAFMISPTVHVYSNDVHSMPLTQIYSPLSVAAQISYKSSCNHSITRMPAVHASGEEMEEKGYSASSVVIIIIK